jgi:hypothetical protein
LSTTSTKSSTGSPSFSPASTFPDYDVLIAEYDVSFSEYDVVLRAALVYEAFVDAILRQYDVVLREDDDYKTQDGVLVLANETRTNRVRHGVGS